MNQTYQVIIVGGGLAGLTAAIHLASAGTKVALFEKESYPKHKVCGEYVSNEIKDYLTFLGVDWDALMPMGIQRTQISIPSGKSVFAILPLGGMGMSRFELDQHLYQIALSLGVKFFFETVTDIQFYQDYFKVYTPQNEEFHASVVLGAYGKRSGLDFTMKRSFLQEKSPWLGVKSHYHGDFPDDLVGLHHFEGGYCGVSKVNQNTLNICYLVAYHTFKRFKNIEHFEKEVLYKNPFLKAILESSQSIFDKPLTISQISFESKTRIEQHVLMLGDAAGMIHPLCGNGMAMAIHSAKLASESVLGFLNLSLNRKQMESNYDTQWNNYFKKRLFFGKLLSKALLNKNLNVFLMNVALKIPFIIPMIIKHTHGKPIK